MKSKYENRAKQILTESLEWLEGNYDMSEDETRSILKAMCNLGEEVERQLNVTLDGYSNQICIGYTKQEVEELLQKQRELCVEKAELDTITLDAFYAIINKNTILNAKINI